MIQTCTPKCLHFKRETLCFVLVNALKIISTMSLIRTSIITLLAFQCAILADLIKDLELLPAFKQLCFGLLFSPLNTLLLAVLAYFLTLKNCERKNAHAIAFFLYMCFYVHIINKDFYNFIKMKDECNSDYIWTVKKQ